MMRHRPGLALLAAAGCLATAIAVWMVAFGTSQGAAVDAATLSGFTGLQGARSETLARFLSGLADPVPFALFGAALVCLALARGRPRLALTVAVVLAGSSVTTQLIKAGLEQPAAWPSGHTTAAMSLALCLVVVVPARRRPLAAAVGGTFALAVVYSILILSWHLPSDVIGGFCVAAAWTLAGLAALAIADRRWAPRAGRRQAVRLATSLGPVLAAGAALAGLAGALAAGRAEAAGAYAQTHTIFLAGAAGIAFAALALTAALAAVLRED